MPQPPSYAHVPAVFDAAAPACGASGQQHKLAHHVPDSSADYWGLMPMEPMESYVSSCAVDSAQNNSCPMDWAGAVPCAAVADPAAALPSMRASAVPLTLLNHTAAAGRAGGSLASAAAAGQGMWAWLSDLAVGGEGEPPAQAAAAAAAAAHCTSHTSRRLFTPAEAHAAPSTSSMQWRLQQQAQQLQAQLAAATQQLQMHSIAFNAAPGVTTAR